MITLQMCSNIASRPNILQNLSLTHHFNQPLNPVIPTSSRATSTKSTVTIATSTVTTTDAFSHVSAESSQTQFYNTSSVPPVLTSDTNTPLETAMSTLLWVTAPNIHTSSYSMNSLSHSSETTRTNTPPKGIIVGRKRGIQKTTCRMPGVLCW